MIVFKKAQNGLKFLLNLLTNSVQRVKDKNFPMRLYATQGVQEAMKLQVMDHQNVIDDDFELLGPQPPTL